jgi:RNA polymerase sigma-70 factor (ECF subfamily)
MQMMSEQMEVNEADISRCVEEVFRAEGDQVLAALIGSLHDFDLAQDVLQEALLTALERWPRDGRPARPAAWLFVTARRKAIDYLRRAGTLARKQTLLQSLAAAEQQEQGLYEDDAVTAGDAPFPDERLKLIFTCCHPALNLDAQVALTLHTLGRLSTAEIAHAFLVAEPTLAQRLVRAKRKIRAAGIPYAVPAPQQLAERLEGVLAVLYLIFNAGYSAPLGDSLVRHELAGEAIRLARTLLTLLSREPNPREEPEALGLLALMLLHDARRAARTGAQGELLLLEAQDRALWDRAQIAEGEAILEQALAYRRPGPYQIQAAISALHCQAARAEETDWFQIALLYAKLVELNRSPVVRLNWAVAVAMATCPANGLALLAELQTDPTLSTYYLFHAARADLLRRAGDAPGARAAYQQALDLAHNRVERLFLQGRLAQMEAPA